MANKSGINLLKSPEKTFLEKLLMWVLTGGRVLVILTEAIALGAFLFRFGLDMKLVDLRDKIKPLRAYIELKKDQEAQYRDLQDRLKTVKKYDDLAGNSNKLFAHVIDLAKGKLTFNSITLGLDGVKIDAVARSTASLADFVNGLKNTPEVKSISIEKVEDKPSSAQINVVFSLTVAPSL